MGRKEQEEQGLEMSKHVVSCDPALARPLGHMGTCIVPQQQLDLYVKKLLFCVPDSECHYLCMYCPSRGQKL